MPGPGIGEAARGPALQEFPNDSAFVGLQRNLHALALTRLHARIQQDMLVRTEASYIAPLAIVAPLPWPESWQQDPAEATSSASGGVSGLRPHFAIGDGVVDSSAYSPGVRTVRFLAAQGLVLAGSIATFRKFDEFFGRQAQPFRLGNDWAKDRALHIDELLHFQGSYRFAQGLRELYLWSGVKPGLAHLLGTGIAAMTMTYLEYVDGKRPSDEASVSDFAANLMGVGFAFVRNRFEFLQKFDLRVSYRDYRDPFRREMLLDYDRITHWVMYDASDKVHAPLEFGIGYGVENAFTGAVKPRYFIGAGIGLGRLLDLAGVGNGGVLRWLNVYHLGLSVQVN